MANKIESTNLSHSSFVDSSSRYNKSDIIYWGEKKFITFETYKRKNRTDSSDDRFYVITKPTEYRPDKVSLRSYGTVSLWWKLLEANNMKDILEFKAGVNIVIPAALL